MKRLFSIILCVGIMLGAYGCKKRNNAADLEKRLTDELIKSGYVSGTIDGKIKTEITGMGEQELNINGSFETDISGGFPLSKMSGTIGLANLVNMPFEIKLSEEKAETTIFGQTKTYEIDEGKHQKIKTAVSGISSHQAMLNKEVKETTINDKKALEITYDTNQLNGFLTMSDSQDGQTKIDDLKLYYVLTDSETIDEIIITLRISGKQKFEVDAKLKPSSIGKY